MANETQRVMDFPAKPAQFGTSFVKSEGFKSLFRDGMALIEDTAGYLDGHGREEANRLGRIGSLTYASESMRLTTRLMQIASWLLLQRAVAEGEITPDQAGREKERVKLVAQAVTIPAAEYEVLPERLRDLIDLSLRLHDRVMHLDKLVVEPPAAPRRASPVAMQHDLLKLAFASA
jgi:regulator of CtrA degradation